MSAPRDIVFSYVDGDEHPPCDCCQARLSQGAVAAHLIRRPGVALLVLCAPCSVEIACLVVREFWPKAPPPSAPPDPSPSEGGAP
jgi:hypothetical protein